MRKIIATILCLGMISGAFLGGLPANAASDGVITLDRVTGVPGDEVAIGLNVSDNPGYMAMTITITYDESVLTYVKYKRGYLTDYLVVDHGGYLRFVNCQAGDKQVNSAMITLIFKIKDNAQTGSYPVTIERKKGDFCNWDQKTFLPEIVPGGVDILFTGSNCSHSFSEWKTKIASTCLESGLDERTCTICGSTELRETKKSGHSYSVDFTIDRAATADESGEMSRHCLNCDARTDITNFSIEDAGEQDFENVDGGSVKNNNPETVTPDTPDNPPNGTDTQVGENQDYTVPVDDTTPDTSIIGETAPENKTDKGMLAKLYSYFLGDDTSPGIISLILDSAPKYFEKSFTFKLITTLLTAVMFI